MQFHRGATLQKYLLAMPQLFAALLYHINVLTACLGVRRVASVAQISRERSIFLPLLQKSLLREKKKLHLGRINTSSDQSKMDDTSDLLNLEQKLIRPLSGRSCKMSTTAARTRAEHQEELVADTRTALGNKEMLQVAS